MKKLTLPSSCKEFLSVWIVTVPAAVLTMALTIYPAKKLAQHPADQTAITFFDLLLPVLAAGIISLAAIAVVTLMVFLLRRKKDAPALPEKARFRPCERLGIRLSLIILTVFTTVFFGADELLTSTLSIRHFRKGSIFWAQTFHECLFWCSLIFLLGYIVCAVRTAAGGYTRTLLWTTAACNIAAVGIIFYLYIGVEEPFGRFRSNEYLYMGMLLDSQNLFKPFLAAVLYTADIFIVLYKIYRSYDDSFPYIRRSPDLKTLCGLLITVALFAAFVTPFAIIYEGYTDYREDTLAVGQICRTALTVLAVSVIGTVLLFFILKLFIRFTKQPSRIAPFNSFERFEVTFRIIVLTVFAVIFFAAERLLMIYIAAYEVRVRLLNPGAAEKWQPIFAVVFLLGFIVAFLRKLEGCYTRRLMWTTVLCDTAALVLCLYVFLSPYDFVRVIEVYPWFPQDYPLMGFILQHFDKSVAVGVFLYYSLDIFDTVWSLPRKKA